MATEWQTLGPEVARTCGLTRVPALADVRIDSVTEETRLRFNALVPVVCYSLCIAEAGAETLRVDAVYWPGDALWEIEDWGR